eukprot:88486-Prorocentrum_minimum.AAC.2
MRFFSLTTGPADYGVLGDQLLRHGEQRGGDPGGGPRPGGGPEAHPPPPPAGARGWRPRTPARARLARVHQPGEARHTPPRPPRLTQSVQLARLDLGAVASAPLW